LTGIEFQPDTCSPSSLAASFYTWLETLGDIKQAFLRRRSPWWPLGTAVGDSLLFKVFQNLGNDCRVFNAGNDLDWTFALLTRFDIDIEYPFQSLHPCH
jgi:hypothetical protein